MTSKQRVMKSLNFERVERLATFDGFWGAFTENWRKSMNLPDAQPREHYAIDVRICVADETAWPTKAGLVEDMGSERIERDGWGRLVRRLKDGYFAETIEVAVPDKSALDGLEFDDPKMDSRYEGFLKSVAALRDRYCPFCKIGGPFLRTAFVRGEMDFLMDIASDPSFARELAERVADHIMVVGLESLRRGDLYDTGIWMYDDMAYNDNPMFSPDQFERIFLPSYRKLTRAFKDAGAAKVVVHSDGNIGPVLDMLVDAGIDAINPVEPKAGMDLLDLRRRYGDKLAYIGGMCNAHVLPRGTRAEIKAQVDRIKEAAQDGGVIIGAHSIGSDVPPESYHYYQSLVAQPI